MKSIFVGNLSFKASEEALRSLFEGYGKVECVAVAKDPATGQARGFGFVEMTGDADGNRAIGELNGREVDGKPITVNEARPRAVPGLRRSGGRK